MRTFSLLSEHANRCLAFCSMLPLSRQFALTTRPKLLSTKIPQPKVVTLSSSIRILVLTKLNSAKSILCVSGKELSGKTSSLCSWCLTGKARAAKVAR